MHALTHDMADSFFLLVARVIEAWNFVGFVAMDVSVGRVLATVVFQLVAAQLQSLDLCVTIH